MPEDMIRLKGNHVTADRRLDRVPEFDPASRRFGIASILPDKPQRSYTWRTGRILDQGSEGACVGFGWGHELLARPRVVFTVDDVYARNIYREAQKRDDWPGEDYSGTSVLAGAKVVKDMGHILEYRWGFNIDDLIMAVGYQGPAVLGLNWYTGMMDTDADGYIRPTGQVEGGHCICVVGVNVKQRRFQLPNSWGTDWGDGGLCFLTFDDMDRLLHEQGEQCIPVGRQKVL